MDQDAVEDEDEEFIALPPCRPPGLQRCAVLFPFFSLGLPDVYSWEFKGTANHYHLLEAFSRKSLEAMQERELSRKKGNNVRIKLSPAISLADLFLHPTNHPSMQYSKAWASETMQQKSHISYPVLLKPMKHATALVCRLTSKFVVIIFFQFCTQRLQAAPIVSTLSCSVRSILMFQ